MLAAYSNSFALQSMSQGKKQKYGMAIFPASTLLNHSCNPNTTVVAEKDHQVSNFDILFKRKIKVFINHNDFLMQ